MWQIEISKLDLVWRQFWNSEIRKFLRKQPVFLKCLMSAICWARCKTTSVSIYFCSFLVLVLLNLLHKLLSHLGLFQEKKYAKLEKNLAKTNWNWGWLISGLIDIAQWAFHENWLWYQKFPLFWISEPPSKQILLAYFYLSDWNYFPHFNMRCPVVRIQLKTEAWFHLNFVNMYILQFK